MSIGGGTGGGDSGVAGKDPKQDRAGDVVGMGWFGLVECGWWLRVYCG